MLQTIKRTTRRISEKLYPTGLDHPPRSFWILFSLGDSVRGRKDIGKLCNFFLFTTVQDLKFGDISNFNLCLLVLYLLYLIALLHWELVLLLLKVDVNVVPVHYKEWAMYSAVTPPYIKMNFPKNPHFSQNDTSSSFPNNWPLRFDIMAVLNRESPCDLCRTLRTVWWPAVRWTGRGG